MTVNGVKNRYFKGYWAAVCPRSAFQRGAGSRSRARVCAIPRGLLRCVCSCVLPLALSLGCPLYEEQCDSRNDCAAGYRCDRFSQRCEPVGEQSGCVRPEQCGASETCTPDFVCRPGSCDYYGCVSGYRCDAVQGVHACVLDRDASVAPVDAALPDTGAGGAPPVPSDASSGGGSNPVAPTDGGDAAADASG